MAEKLTKHEWQEKLKLALNDKNFYVQSIIKEDADNIWWGFSKDESVHGMRLNELGFALFNCAGFEFNKYECEVPIWTGALTLGLKKIQCPYYLEKLKNGIDYNFYITDDEYAMLLMFSNNDLTLFAKGLTK